MSFLAGQVGTPVQKPKRMTASWGGHYLLPKLRAIPSRRVDAR